MKYVKTFEGFFSSLFSKEDDDVAKKILNTLKTCIEEQDPRLGKISKYADYKRSVRFQSKEGKIYDISIQKSSSPRRTSTKMFFGATSSTSYTLVINGKHYNASESICKNIWNLLDKDFTSSYKGKSDILKDFE